MSEPEDAPILFQHRAKNGEVMDFDISRSACNKFGFYYSDRVETPLGSASVVGVANKSLWFLVDGDPGASFWDNGKCYEDLLQLGIYSISDKPTVAEKKGYKVKTISYAGKNTQIVLQNENGPCPLIGISNVLALRGGISIDGEGTNKNVVTLQGMIDKLQAYLLEQNIERGEEALKAVDNATKIMPQLEFGLDVNFNFKEADNFEKTEQCKLFEFFGIRLVHGWLYDPEELELKTAIGDNTYNDLMNKLVAIEEDQDRSSSQKTPQPPTQEVVAAAPAAPTATTTPAASDSPQKKQEEPPKPLTQEDFNQASIIRSFLNSTRSQLTAHGLAVLQNSLKEGELCVFFRNNHFSTLTKHEGNLYILVTDIGYERERNIVWDLLATVDGSSVFCTSDFKNTEEENTEEVVNTLELMGFSKGAINDCLPQIPREVMHNTESAIQRAINILNKQPESQVRV